MTRHGLIFVLTAIALAGCGQAPPAALQARPAAGAIAPASLVAPNTGRVVTPTIATGEALPEAPRYLSDGAKLMIYAATTPAQLATDVKVITFNTAIGNPKIKTDQADFPQLPFYRAVIEGADDAAILCLQEVGNAQREAVERLAKNNAGFTYKYLRVGIRQGNMLLVPRRYTLDDYDGTYFGMAQVKAGAKAIWNWIGPGGRPNFSQLVEPRGFQMARLTDTRTGRRFTVYNTHLSFTEGLQEAQAKKLFDRVHQEAARVPVVVAGDLNVHTQDTDPTPTAGKDARVRAMFGGLVDMGPVGRPPYKTNIDYVLAKGFTPVSSKWYTGNSISLPGSPDARTVSDHYAEEDVIRFE